MKRKVARLPPRLPVCLLVLLIGAVMPLHAEEQGSTVSQRVEWAAGRVVVEITHALDPSTPSLLRAKADAESEVEERLPDLLAQAIGTVTVDSSHTFAQVMGADAGLFARMSDLAAQAERTDLFLTGDFSTLVSRYAVPFFGARGIASPLFPSVDTPIRRRLGDVTTRAYTGLLIFARGMLPETGTSRLAVAAPAVFPRIWDEKMNLLLDKDMCSPAALARWGMVGYSQEVDDPTAVLRVGQLPLRLAARGVFGENHTDLVISTEGARQLLARSENIALLREGRIVIVYESLGQAPASSSP